MPLNLLEIEIVLRINELKLKKFSKFLLSQNIKRPL